MHLSKLMNYHLVNSIKKSGIYCIAVITLGISILFTASPTFAQIGITAVPFLQIEPDSRGSSMGNTGVAIADNASAIFWNPAGLAFQSGKEISITHSEWLANFNADLFYDNLVGKYHVEGIGTFGSHVTFLNLGEQARTNEQGLEQGRFNSYELAAGISYGGLVSKHLGLGIGVRFIYSSLADGSVSGQQIDAGSTIGIDLAWMYQSSTFSLLNRMAGFNVGMNLSNIGPGMQYTDNSQKDPLPTLLRFGWSLSMDLDKKAVNRLTITSEVSKIMARDDTEGFFEGVIDSWGTYDRNNGIENVSLTLIEQFMVGAGIEYNYNNLFSVRSGYYYEHPENGNREFITLGAGIRYHIFGVDFSYIAALEEDHPLANTTRFSLLLNF